MKLKKLISLILATTMSATLFAGCGSGQPSTASKPTGASQAASAQEKVSIKVSGWDNSANPQFDNTIKAFEAKNPNIKVEFIDIPSAEYTNKLSIMLNGGSDLDAFWIKDSDTSLSMSNKGQLEDLSAYIKKDGIDVSQYNGLAENFVFDGKTAGLPFRTDYYVLYYNKDIFDAAGVAYPTNDMTWAEFEQTAKKITSGDGANKKFGAFIHSWQACVENWSVADGKNNIMATDYSFFKPYYDMTLRMQNKDKSIMDYATIKTANIHYSSPFLNGKIGMMPMGTWFMATLNSKIKSGESTVKWGVATIPHAEGVEAGRTVGSTTPMSINAASKKKDAAWEFVKFATSIDGATEISKIGVIPGIANDATLGNVAAVEGMPEGVLKALTVKGITLDRPIDAKVAEVNHMLGEEHDLIMLGESTLDQGLANMAKRSKEIQGK